jgi:predicted dienelactone hydrolase
MGRRLRWPKRLTMLWLFASASLSCAYVHPLHAAEKVQFKFLGVTFDVSLQELQAVAESGQFTGQWLFINQLLAPEKEKSIQAALTYTPPFKRETIQDILSSPSRPRFILKQISQIVQGVRSQQSVDALEKALLDANQSPQGLNAISFIKAYPGPVLAIDLDVLLQATSQLRALIEETQYMVSLIQVQANQVSPSHVPSLATFADAGSRQWEKRTYPWVDESRNRYAVTTDLYLPNSNPQNLSPLVIISYGLGEDRNTFDYLAKHLASHGFAVAIPANKEINATAIHNVFEGYEDPPQATAALNSPKNISFILDQLEQNPQLSKQVNTKTVAVVGNSYGAFTALAVGGASFDPGYNPQACDFEHEFTLNISLFLQCELMQLPQPSYQLGDRRVTAIVAANPFTSKSFSPASLQQLAIPTMLLSGSADMAVPMILGATPAYSKIGSSNKYFVMLEKGTHFSVLPPADQGVFPVPVTLIGPSQEIGNRYFKALVLTFVKGYLQNDQAALSALSQSGTAGLSQPEMPLLILQGSLDTHAVN